MTTKLNRATYAEIIQGDLEWLLKQPRTLERTHIVQIVCASGSHEFDCAERIAKLEAEVSTLVNLRNAAEGRAERCEAALRQCVEALESIRLCDNGTCSLWTGCSCVTKSSSAVDAAKAVLP